MIRCKWVLLGLCLGALAACSTETEYEQLVASEMERGVRNDSLFLGFYFGMPQEDFYNRCWQLNKEGLLRQGLGNTTVLYELEEGLEYPADLNFYPTFADGKIVEMPMSVEYQSWAPWNKSLSADSLVPDLAQLFQNWFGGRDFLQLDHPEYGQLWVKVDGNRRITLYPVNGKFVQVLFADLTRETAETIN